MYLSFTGAAPFQKGPKTYSVVIKTLMLIIRLCDFRLDFTGGVTIVFHIIKSLQIRVHLFFSFLFICNCITYMQLKFGFVLR